MGISNKTKMSDTDKGLKQIMANLQDLNGTVVKTGILETSANFKYKSGTTVLQAAVYNEYGIGVPQRSFLRSTFDSNEKKWTKKIAKNMVLGSIKGINPQITAQFTGRLVRDSVKRTITSTKTPGNAPRTVRNKGFNDPLIHTRRLYNEIKFNVQKGKK